jgi:hypothetical protein
MIKVVHNVLYGHRLRALEHECDTRNSHDSAPLGQLPNCFIRTNGAATAAELARRRDSRRETDDRLIGILLACR